MKFLVMRVLTLRMKLFGKETDPHNDAKKKYGIIHDIILYYASNNAKYNWDKITVGLSKQR